MFYFLGYLFIVTNLCQILPHIATMVFIITIINGEHFQMVKTFPVKAGAVVMSSCFPVKVISRVQTGALAVLLTSLVGFIKLSYRSLPPQFGDAISEGSIQPHM